MLTTKNFDVDEGRPLRIELKNLKPALRCIINTIIFQRCFGPLVPEISDEFEVPFAHPNDLCAPNCPPTCISKQIRDSLHAFEESVRKKQSPDCRHFKLVLAFYTKEISTDWWGYAKIIRSEKPWETWTVALELIESNGSDELEKKFKIKETQDALRQIQLSILQSSVSNMSHIPVPKEDPRTKDEVLPYPFLISSVDITTAEAGGIGGWISKAWR